MVRNCVFLSHQHESATEVHDLAQELRVRGIVPWVDKLPGGFAAGDESVREARRVIREDASAFLLYLTEKALESDFIREIELPEALARRKREPDFPIIVATPDYRLGQIDKLTEEQFGYSLGRFHAYALDSKRGENIAEFLVRVSRETLSVHLDTQLPIDPSTIEIQVSSREMLLGTSDELLRIDATSLVKGGVLDPPAWSRLLAGMLDVKRQLSHRYGRPQLLVNGSKHFTTAFMIGRVFNRFPLLIRQTPTEYWPTAGTVSPLDGFSITHDPGSFTLRTLIVEFATGEKAITSGVDALIAAEGLPDGGRVRVQPTDGRVEMTEMLSRSLARAAYGAIDEATNIRKTDEVHLFVAVPQATLMTLGTLFQGMPVVHLYEWNGTSYGKSAVIPSDV